MAYGIKSSGQRYNFKQYDIENGLIQSQVTAITQDNKSRLWIATLGGLSCFNGTQFTNLGKTDGLNSNFLVSLAITPAQNLIIGTERGISMFRNDSLYKYTDLKEWADALTISSSGETFGLSGKNIFKIKGSTTQKIYVTGDSSEIVTAIKTDRSRRVWATVYRRGLYYLDGNQWRKKITGKLVENLIIIDLMIDGFAADKIWLLTTGGIYVAENGKIIKTLDGIKKASTIIQDEKGNLWLGTNKGAWLVSGDQQIHFNAKNGFTDNVVTRIYKDREHNIWLGTDGSGIFKFNSSSYISYDESQGLQNSIVMSIINGPAPDEIWIGTYDGIFAHQNNTIKRINIPSENEDTRRINFLFKDSKRNIWIGTAGGGLWIWKKGIFNRIDRGSQALACNAIVEDRHKNIWLSTNLGCFVLDASGKQITKISAEFGTSLLEIGNNIMLTGSQSGANIIRNKKDITPLKFNPIVGSSILSMLKYKDFVLFGTADNGLVIWNISTGKIKQISTKNGLFSDHVYSLLLDDHGIIWMGTGRGINKLRAKDFSVLLNTNENTLMVECNQNAILKDGNKIWIGTTKGAWVYNNSDRTAMANKPFIFINSVGILAQNTKGNQNMMQVTYKGHELNKKIILPYNHNHLNINFTGIYLTNPKSVMYKYQLKGLDDKYGKPSYNSSVNYTALPPGNYIFQVKAITSSGITSANTASFEIEITPPYYQTNIFKVFVLVLILLFITIAVFVIINLSERQRKLRLKIKIEEQFKIRKQTAEDFHDDIGNKLTRISVLSEVLSSMTDKYDHEKRAIIGKINTNVNELYNGTREILWSLNPKNDTIGELLSHIQEFGCDMFDDTSVHFNDNFLIKDRTRRLSLEVSRNILMIFKEAINNALKYSKADQVSFTAIMIDDNLDIKLEDNGRGFDTTSVKNGNGLNNMQVRAIRIKGNLNITSNIKGTTVALSIKL